jgi:hypothetical protein
MKFLELHYDGVKPVLINLENVTCINTDATGESENTVISFNGSSESYVMVSESYADIVNAIKEHF